MTDTHTQTYDDGIYHASTASRSKNLHQLQQGYHLGEPAPTDVTPEKETNQTTTESVSVCAVAACLILPVRQVLQVV